MKLHLGCGLQYLEGYINIDYPNDDHIPGLAARADRFMDITALSYPHESIEEIRLHHVFEHFPRPDALALICRWRDWLKTGGLLRMETPDMMASAWLLLSPSLSHDSKQQVMRHLFGSHEALWAIHRDGWYKEKLERTLTSLGFESLAFETTEWGCLRNIEVTAHKTSKPFDFHQYEEAAKRLLTASTVRVGTKDPEVPEAWEMGLLELWLDAWKKLYTRT